MIGEALKQTIKEKTHEKVAVPFQDHVTNRPIEFKRPGAHDYTANPDSPDRLEWPEAELSAEELTGDPDADEIPEVKPEARDERSEALLEARGGTLGRKALKHLKKGQAVEELLVARQNLMRQRGGGNKNINPELSTGAPRRLRNRLSGYRQQIDRLQVAQNGVEPQRINIKRQSDSLPYDSSGKVRASTDWASEQAHLDELQEPPGVRREMHGFFEAPDGRRIPTISYERHMGIPKRLYEKGNEADLQARKDEIARQEEEYKELIKERIEAYLATHPGPEVDLDDPIDLRPDTGHSEEEIEQIREYSGPEPVPDLDEPEKAVRRINTRPYHPARRKKEAKQASAWGLINRQAWRLRHKRLAIALGTDPTGKLLKAEADKHNEKAYSAIERMQNRHDKRNAPPGLKEHDEMTADRKKRYDDERRGERTTAIKDGIVAFNDRDYQRSLRFRKAVWNVIGRVIEKPSLRRAAKLENRADSEARKVMPIHPLLGKRLGKLERSPDRLRKAARNARGRIDSVSDFAGVANSRLADEHTIAREHQDDRRQHRRAKETRRAAYNREESMRRITRARIERIDADRRRIRDSLDINPLQRVGFDENVNRMYARYLERYERRNAGLEPSNEEKAELYKRATKALSRTVK